MSSKFLISSSTVAILDILKSGSENLNVASLIDQSLTTSLPICSDSTKKLISRQITISDLNYTPATNPMTTNLDLGTYAITNVSTMNTTGIVTFGSKGYISGTRPILSGGFNMITNTTVTNTTVETSIIGAGVGSLTSIANTASAGNASRLRAGGTVNITGNPTVTLRLYAGPTGTTLLSSFVIALSTLSANSPWQLNTDIAVKSIGVATVASIQINATFQVFDTTSVSSYVHQALNNTTYDTTVINVLRLTIQWSAANASNIFTTNLLNTHSLYVV